MNTLEKVKEFHKVFNRPINEIPCIDNDEVNELRVRLLREEVEELEFALQIRDRTKVLDALTDIQYILDGSYISLGMYHYKEEAFEEVHSSNMRKLDENGLPIIREDGKILKPKEWKPPELYRFFDGIDY